MTCDLCILEKRTRWYYEDAYFVIINCGTCNIPMIVIKRHTMKFSDQLLEKMIEVAHQLFGVNIEFRTEQKKIKDHWHRHIIIPQTPF